MPPQFTADWFSARIPSWEKLFAPYKGKPGLNFLEVGAFQGRSACWLLEHVLTQPDAHLTCIDIFEPNDEYREILTQFPVPGIIPETPDAERLFDENIAQSGAQTRVTKLKGESHTLLRTLPAAAFDCIYIDGSHRAPNVLTDIILAWDLLKPEGILILDDYTWICFPDEPLKTPRPAIDAFLSIFEQRYTLLEKDSQVIVRKRGTGILMPSAAPAA